MERNSNFETPFAHTQKKKTKKRVTCWFLQWSTSGKIKQISADAFADHSAKLSKCFILVGAVVVLAWIPSKIKIKKNTKRKKKINNCLVILKYDSV